MNPKTYRPWLFLALASTLLAAVFAPAEEDVALPVQAVTKPRAPNPGMQRGMLTESRESVLHIVPRQSSDRMNVLFAATSSESRKPDTTVTAVVALPPTAPALPFRVLGYYEENGESSVFLDDRGESLVVKVGDTLRHDTYRVDSITEGQLQLTYLPLGHQQTLLLGEHP